MSVSHFIPGVKWFLVINWLNKRVLLPGTENRRLLAGEVPQKKERGTQCIGKALSWGLEQSLGSPAASQVVLPTQVANGTFG